jgi:hypothetical protein
MAQLGTPYPFPPIDYSKPAKEFFAEQEEALNKIPKDRIIRFSVADGYAVYYVKSFSPLVLQHVDYGDGWQISDAHIRGLRKADVEQMLAREASIRKLFSK